MEENPAIECHHKAKELLRVAALNLIRFHVKLHEHSNALLFMMVSLRRSKLNFLIESFIELKMLRLYLIFLSLTTWKSIRAVEELHVSVYAHLHPDKRIHFICR